MNVEDRLGRILKLLQGSIRAAGFTQTEVDERIGRRRGYLSHVFQRRVDLKLVDLLRALEVLEVDPGRFFAAALGGSRRDNRAALEDLMSLVADLRTGGSGGAGSSSGGFAWQTPPRPANEYGDDQELMERVRAAVRSILAEGMSPISSAAQGYNGDGVDSSR